MKMEQMVEYVKEHTMEAKQKVRDSKSLYMTGFDLKLSNPAFVVILTK